MLKKKINYVDYNGVERSEEFHFNLTEAEVMRMELSTAGGLAETIQRVVDAQDSPSIIKIFEELVLTAYGEKSPDGKRFIKNDKVREAFSQTQAYSNLFMELATNAESASVFVNAIIPQGSTDSKHTVDNITSIPTNTI